MEHSVGQPKEEFGQENRTIQEDSDEPPDSEDPGRAAEEGRAGKAAASESPFSGDAEGDNQAGGNSTSNTTQKPRFSSRISSPGRAKSALRLKYEAEAEVLRKKIGDLESIRAQLGLSQRAICQLLWVDPSAWTRWAKRDEKAPPHIYRALQWYLALEEKYPALDVNFWLATARQAHEPQAQFEAIAKANRDIALIKKDIRKEIKEEIRAEILDLRITLGARSLETDDLQGTDQIRVPSAGKTPKRNVGDHVVVFILGAAIGVTLFWLFSS